MSEPKTKVPEIDFAAFTIPQIDALIAKAQKARVEKKDTEVANLKAEFENRLQQLNLSFVDVFPEIPKAGISSGKPPKAKAASTLETPERGATYQNPTNPAETWTAGVKKGRSPTWVMILRETGELHRHKLA